MIENNTVSGTLSYEKGNYYLQLGSAQKTKFDLENSDLKELGQIIKAYNPYRFSMDISKFGKRSLHKMGFIPNNELRRTHQPLSRKSAQERR